jgi:hypothetical protein
MIDPAASPFILPGWLYEGHVDANQHDDQYHPSVILPYPAAPENPHRDDNHVQIMSSRDFRPQDGQHIPGLVNTPDQPMESSPIMNKKGILKGGKQGGSPEPQMPEEEEKIEAVKGKKKVPPPSYMIHFPSLNTGQWEDVVHAVMWRVGRYFGFQAFNINPKTKNSPVRVHSTF